MALLTGDYKERGYNVLAKLRSTGFFSIVGASVLNKIIMFVSGMILVRVLSKSDYGAYSYALNIISYFVLFNGLGAASCVVQFCVEQKTESAAEQAYRTICWLGIVWDILLTASIVFVGLFVELPIENANMLLLVLAPFPFFSLLVELQQQRLRSQFRTSQYAWATNINSVLIVIFSVLGAVLASSIGLSLGRVVGMVASAVLVYLIFHVSIFRRPSGITGAFVVDILKMAMTVCATNAISQALMLIGTSLIGTVLADAEATASYSTATTIPFALAFIPSMIVIYITPYFVKNAHNRQWVIKNWFICTVAVFIISVLVGIICLASADWLIPFIFGEKYRDAISSFRILIVAFAVASSFRTVSGNILASHRRYTFNLFSNIASLFVCVAVTSAALSMIGLDGAAIGYLVAMVVGSAINVAGLLVFAGRPKAAESIKE